MQSTSPLCRRVTTRDEMTACRTIRETVFQQEQAVDPAIEADGRDGEAVHYIAEIDGRAIATARARVLDDKIKIERVAVTREARGRRVGEALMRFMMDDLSGEARGRPFFLSSQAQAVPFYERLGFTVCSEEYFEAGIAHREMRAEAASR